MSKPIEADKDRSDHRPDPSWGAGTHPPQDKPDIDAQLRLIYWRGRNDEGIEASRGEPFSREDRTIEEATQALYTRLLEVIGENDIAPDNISPKGSAKHRIWARNALRAAQRKALAELFNVGGDDA